MPVAEMHGHSVCGGAEATHGALIDQGPCGLCAHGEKGLVSLILPHVA